jgi:hypothetical protein
MLYNPHQSVMFNPQGVGAPLMWNPGMSMMVDPVTGLPIEGEGKEEDSNVIIVKDEAEFKKISDCFKCVGMFIWCLYSAHVFLKF